MVIALLHTSSTLIRLPIHMTTNRKLALVMGRLTAEDAAKSLQNSHCIPELESVQVSASNSR